MTDPSTGGPSRRPSRPPWARRRHASAETVPDAAHTRTVAARPDATRVARTTAAPRRRSDRSAVGPVRLAATRAYLGPCRSMLPQRPACHHGNSCQFPAFAWPHSSCPSPGVHPLVRPSPNRSPRRSPCAPAQASTDRSDQVDRNLPAKNGGLDFGRCRRRLPADSGATMNALGWISRAWAPGGEPFPVNGRCERPRCRTLPSCCANPQGTRTSLAPTRHPMVRRRPCPLPPRPFSAYLVNRRKTNRLSVLSRARLPIQR